MKMNYLMIHFVFVPGRCDTTWHSQSLIPIMRIHKKLAKAGEILPKWFLGCKELGSYEAAFLQKG